MPDINFALLHYCVQRLVDLIRVTKMDKRIGFGSIIFEVKIQDGEATYAEPQIRLGIKL